MLGEVTDLFIKRGGKYFFCFFFGGIFLFFGGGSEFVFWEGCRRVGKGAPLSTVGWLTIGCSTEGLFWKPKKFFFKCWNRKNLKKKCDIGFWWFEMLLPENWGQLVCYIYTFLINFTVLAVLYFTIYHFQHIQHSNLIQQNNTNKWLLSKMGIIF